VILRAFLSQTSPKAEEAPLTMLPRCAREISILALIIAVCFLFPNTSWAQLGADGEDETEESKPAGTEVKVGLSLGRTYGEEVQGSERSRTVMGDLQGYSVGADLRIRPKESRLIFNPTFGFYGGTNDGITLWSISANLLYNIKTTKSTYRPYTGIGLVYYRGRVNGEFGPIQLSERNNKAGPNLMFGIEFLEGTIQPFLEARYSPVLRSEPGFLEGEPGHLFVIGGGLDILL